MRACTFRVWWGKERRLEFPKGQECTCGRQPVLGIFRTLPKSRGSRWQRGKVLRASQRRALERESPSHGRRVAKDPNRQFTKKESEFGIFHILKVPTQNHKHINRARPFYALSTSPPTSVTLERWRKKRRSGWGQHKLEEREYFTLEGSL